MSAQHFKAPTNARTETPAQRVFLMTPMKFRTEWALWSFSFKIQTVQGTRDSNLKSFNQKLQPNFSRKPFMYFWVFAGTRTSLRTLFGWPWWYSTHSRPNASSKKLTFKRLVPICLTLVSVCVLLSCKLFQPEKLCLKDIIQITNGKYSLKQIF